VPGALGAWPPVSHCAPDWLPSDGRTGLVAAGGDQVKAKGSDLLGHGCEEDAPMPRSMVPADRSGFTIPPYSDLQ
jgi:hypothetical protein